LNRRVVVTGIGIVAANGIGLEAFWKTLLAGESGIGPITLFDPTDLKTRIAGEVKNFNALDFIPPAMKPQRMGRFTQLSLAATRLALEDAQLTAAQLKQAEPVAISLGVSTSATDVIEKQVLRIHLHGRQSASPFTAISSLPQAACGAISALLGTAARTVTVSTGCPAGLDAVALAAAGIRAGQYDLAVAGGTDAPITLLTVATFCAANAMSTRNDDPAHASRPFDLHRDGGLIAEGSGMLVLETLDAALARGRRPYLEIRGYGVAADPDRAQPGAGLQLSMNAAIANSGLRATDVDYVCAHGPSDPLLDRVETEMLKATLGSWAYRVPVSSVKGVTGNPLAAAGPFQLAACALALRDGIVPPTANYETPDPDCDLDYVPVEPRRAALRHALINGHGFGGSNSSLVVGSIAAP